jgi:hypothetical protein
MDFGAKGDGKTDDTAAIQAAIDHAFTRGGGCIFFPYTQNGYRIASPGIETYQGRTVRAQLVIPPGNANISFMGEMPCRVLYSYQIRPLDCAAQYKPTCFGDLPACNTRLFSDWDAPEEHDPTAHPWSILAAPEGDSCAGRFSASMVSIANLEFRVKMDREKMYPTQSAVNLQHVSRVHVSDSQFCLNEQVGDAVEWKYLQENPCHTVGLMMSGDQNDNQILRNVAVQGFKYGLVLGEHVQADCLYIHNCEEGLVFHDASHYSLIQHVIAQHNRVILSTTTTNLFGHGQSPCNVEIGSINYESGRHHLPLVSRLVTAVNDPENRFRGYLKWHQPWGDGEFPVVGAKNLKITKFGE